MQIHYKNPNIFSSCYYKELMELEGDTGGRAIIKRHDRDVSVWFIPEKEAKDIDVREEIL